MRVFSGVILGYLLFRLLWFALFRVTNTDPHAPSGIAFEAGSIIFGLLFALAAGYTASFIGGRPPRHRRMAGRSTGGHWGAVRDGQGWHFVGADGDAAVYGSCGGRWRMDLRAPQPAAGE